jgi:predicted transposase YbfD/YdcC
MEHSTATARGDAGDPAPVVFALSDLWRRLAALPDQRHRRGKRYALPVLLLLIVLAKLSGEDRPSGIAEWVAHRRAALAQTLGIRLPRAPHHNTYRRLLAQAVVPGALDAAVSEFFRALPQVGGSVLISIDGKTLKGTIDAAEPHGAHLLVAYLPQEGIVLLQMPAGRKDSEIRVAPALVEALDLRGKIVAADALHTQRALSAQILAAGGDYLWVVKDNQPTLRTDIAELFTADDRTVEGGHLPHDWRTARQVAKGHGRREIRRVTVSTELNGYSDWPGLEQVFRLERERITSQSGKYQQEITYGLTSLTPAEASPARVLALTRAYWGVENGLHYRRDVTFHEDATRLTQGHAGHVMATLNNLVIGLLRLAGFTNLAAARRYCGADLARAVALLAPTPRT